LGYVTPWNNHGYDVAKVLFRGKFTHISPVWYSVKPAGPKKHRLEGGHDVDAGWMEEVRAPTALGQRAKVIPRFQFAGWQRENLLEIIEDREVMKELADLIVQECLTQNFDGLVLESPAPGYTTDFLSLLASTLHSHSKTLTLVIPPSKPGAQQEAFSRAQFDALVKVVDAFSLMTYDYSHPGKPGPNSPISWVEENVYRLAPGKEGRAKILLGINLYGFDYGGSGGGSPIVGNQYLELLKKHSPKFTWEDDEAEHVFSYSHSDGEHTVWYPSLKSLEERLALGEELGTGISLWEIGQGLDYFVSSRIADYFIFSHGMPFPVSFDSPFLPSTTSSSSSSPTSSTSSTIFCNYRVSSTSIPVYNPC
ncbi:glycoside hydrolase superfamily, partial [Blyttiomyces helicus]